MTIDFNPETDLDLKRVIEAAPATVWRCWTEPDLLKVWFCPAPWKVTEASIDLRPGGRFFTKMEGPLPDGSAASNASEGCYLEVVHHERLTFTDALRADWRPNGEGFMTATITLAPDGAGGTLYHAIVKHNDAAARDKHAAMGFAEGWGAAAEQLEALAITL
jgi:uncharacterized protein YndB with AHSA1/START domain